MAKAVQFTNNTDESFSMEFGDEQVMYTFAPGQTAMFEEGVARIFARHLAIREINKTEGKDAICPRGKVEQWMTKYIVATDVTGANEQEIAFKASSAKASVPAPEAPEEDENAVLNLRAELDARGISYDKRFGEAKLQALLDEAEDKEESNDEEEFEGAQ